jgi:hypothetical protein
VRSPVAEADDLFTCLGGLVDNPEQLDTGGELVERQDLHFPYHGMCHSHGESGDHFLAEDLDDTLANTVKTPGVSTKGFIGPLDHSLEITLGGGAPTCCGEFGDEALTAVPQVEMHATGKPATHVWDDLPSAKGNQCAMTR